jgi:hypothetical protein
MVYSNDVTGRPPRVSAHERGPIGDPRRLGRGNAQNPLEAAAAPWEAARMSLLSALRLSRQPALAFAAMGAGGVHSRPSCPTSRPGSARRTRSSGRCCWGRRSGFCRPCGSRLGRGRPAWPAGLPAASALLATAFLLPGLATVPFAFAAAMLMVGVTSGLTDVVMNARVSELETAHRRTLMNLNHAMFSFAYAASAFATGLRARGRAAARRGLRGDRAPSTRPSPSW